MGLFKKTTDKVEQAVEIVSDKTTNLVENANEVVEDNKKPIKILLGVATGFFVLGIAANVVRIVYDINATKSVGKPIIINNYIGGKK